ncbi:MAG: hypothetical protein FWF85_04590 [Clostridiales bacterium]|jgi:hypothetical protein|nr:hypothetical protein [Clostridiales bacterium]
MFDAIAWQGSNEKYFGSYGDIKVTTNCYAYALNLKYNPFTDNDLFEGTLQPGALSSGKHDNSTAADILYDNHATTENIIFGAVRKDAWVYGNDFARSDEWEKAPAGMYKVALALGTGNLFGKAIDDYHWYRQDDTGYWSHKPTTLIGTLPTYRDWDGEKITDPATANRKTEGGGDYNETFAGYYITGKPR